MLVVVVRFLVARNCTTVDRSRAETVNRAKKEQYYYYTGSVLSRTKLVERRQGPPILHEQNVLRCIRRSDNPPLNSHDQTHMIMKASRQLESVRKDPPLMHSAYDDTSCIPPKPLVVISIT
jgi:hypothetical protein